MSLIESECVMTWMEELRQIGLIPYVASSELLINHLDLSVFNEQEKHILLEDPAHRPFHEAYLLANSIAFGQPDLKMPNWVYIDCVLMQSAAVGFAMPVDQLPDTVREMFEKDPRVDLSKLDMVPVSGQIAGKAMDGSLVGYSLFSLRHLFPMGSLPSLAVPTKYAALRTYEADQCKRFLGVTQYDNPALMTHARFSSTLEIEHPMLMMHPRETMSFVYSMKIEFNDERIFGPISTKIDDSMTLMDVNDTPMKHMIQERRAQGLRTFIVDPVQIQSDKGLYVVLNMQE